MAPSSWPWRVVLALCVAAPLLRSQIGTHWRTAFWSAPTLEPVSDIPFSKYTHVIYWGNRPQTDCTLAVNSARDAAAHDLTAAGHAAGTKILLHIGDGGAGIEGCTEQSNIDRFVASIVQYVTAHGFDGIDLDWELNPIGTRYSNLIDKLHVARPELVLTMDVNPSDEFVLPASHPNIAQVNVMCYDMDTSVTMARYNSALIGDGPVHKSCALYLNWFEKRGIPPGKLGIGLPFYGRRFSPAAGPWELGTFSPTGGRVTVYYNELVSDPIRWRESNKRWDETFQAQYLSVTSITPNEFVSYTGPEQIRAAVELLRSGGYGGVMVFALEYEYLAGRDGDSRYPLSSALWNALRYPLLTIDTNDPK